MEIFEKHNKGWGRKKYTTYDGVFNFCNLNKNKNYTLPIRKAEYALSIK